MRTSKARNVLSIFVTAALVVTLNPAAALAEERPAATQDGPFSALPVEQLLEGLDYQAQADATYQEG